MVIINWLGLYMTQGSDFLKNFGQILMSRVSLLCRSHLCVCEISVFGEQCDAFPVIFALTKSRAVRLWHVSEVDNNRWG